jgi:V/A-type H+-transporting ATPase subunit K
MRRLLVGLNGFNVIVGLMALGIGLIWLISPSTVIAAEGDEADSSIDGYSSIAAAISTGMATIGAGFAVAGTGAAAVGAIAEKPKSFGQALIFVGLAEGIAIYGLIISFMILNQ